MAAFTNHDFNPWESEIFISAYMGAGRDSIDISKFTKTLKTQFSAQMKIVERRVEVLHALEEQENVESYAKELRDLNERVVAAFLHFDELYQVEDDGQVTFFPLWNEATAAAESLFNTFRQYTRTSSIPVRLVQIKWCNDAVVLYFKFDLLKDPNLNSDMRKSFAPVLNGGKLKTKDELGNQKDCLPSELLLFYHTEPSSDVRTEIFISMAPDYLRVFRELRVPDQDQPQEPA